MHGGRRPVTVTKAMASRHLGLKGDTLTAGQMHILYHCSLFVYDLLLTLLYFIYNHTVFRK